MVFFIENRSTLAVGAASRSPIQLNGYRNGKAANKKMARPPFPELVLKDGTVFVVAFSVTMLVARPPFVAFQQQTRRQLVELFRLAVPEK